MTTEMITATSDSGFVSDTIDTLLGEESFNGGLRGLVVLNLLDALFTLLWVLGGDALEANPIMALAIQEGPDTFILSKIALVSLAVYILWRNREKFIARAAFVPAAILYAYVMGGHIGFALNKILMFFPPHIY